MKEYGPYRNPVVTVTSGAGPAGALTRTSTATYDAAKRPTRTETVESGPGAGVAVAPVVTTYDPVTGKVVKQAGAITTNTYDRYDKPVKATFNNGTSVTYTYDRSVEPRGFVTKVTDSVAGDITPTWGPDGQLESQTMPGGVKLTVGYDAARSPVARTYTRASDGVVIATDAVVSNQKGEWITHNSTVAARSYSYDRLGRLTQAREAVNDAISTCRVRDYAFDTHGNRTDLTTTTGTGASPATCTGNATTVSTRFDSADRVTSTTDTDGGSWVYDGLGRMTTIPASAASTYTATNTAGGASGTVGLGYFVNDLTQTQVQPGSSKTTLALDAIGRFTSSTLATWDTGKNAWSEGVTTTNHYDGGGDRPAWTETTTPEGAATTRYVDGPSGDLTMTTGKDGGRTLLLTDLHGDTIASLPIGDGATTANWTKLTYTASDEYGNPTPLATATNPNPPSINNWHATAQRQQTRLGTTLMGARTYLPSMGIFTTMDPVPGGNTTTYTYPQNPIGQQDLDGKNALTRWVKKTVKSAGRVAQRVGKHFNNNWRTYAKWGLMAAAALGGAACVAASGGICGGLILGTQLSGAATTALGYGISAGLGAAAGAGSYGLGKGKKTASGYWQAAAWGAVGNVTVQYANKVILRASAGLRFQGSASQIMRKLFTTPKAWRP